MLAGGNRRSIGRANEVAAHILKNPEAFGTLVECMWSDSPLVRMRAADAAEKISSVNASLLQPFKAAMLGLLAETDQQEVRWHMAQMIPRLELTTRERHRATVSLRLYLTDRSSIVKAFAIQALADLSQHDPDLRIEVRGIVEEQLRAGTPAVRARCRKLLKKLQS